MLAINSTTYTFGIADYTQHLVDSDDNSPESQLLRAVWVGHLTHEREKAQKAEDARHPLAKQLVKKIFHH